MKMDYLIGRNWVVMAVVLAASQYTLKAHEAAGRGGHKEHPAVLEAEFESYFGRDGYYHFGLGAQLPLGDRHKLGLITHLVREDSDGDSVSSLGAEYGVRLEGGVELETFAFGYFPALEQSAWGIGVRAAKELEAGEHLRIVPFFGPVFARVRAVDAAAMLPVYVSHTMLFGGVTFEAKAVEAMIFGSHSFFSRDPRGLESHVDLEELTHLAVFENNDGFARNSVGAEITWKTGEQLALSARYAAIFFPGETTRHSVMVGPRWAITERVALFAGVQFLRGGPGDNDIGFGGIFFSF